MAEQLAQDQYELCSMCGALVYNLQNGAHTFSMNEHSIMLFESHVPSIRNPSPNYKLPQRKH